CRSGVATSLGRNRHKMSAQWGIRSHRLGPCRQGAEPLPTAATCTMLREPYHPKSFTASCAAVTHSTATTALSGVWASRQARYGFVKLTLCLTLLAQNTAAQNTAAQNTAAQTAIGTDAT